MIQYNPRPVQVRHHPAPHLLEQLRIGLFRLRHEMMRSLVPRAHMLRLQLCRHRLDTRAPNRQHQRSAIALES